ncbi:hypothetical protein OG555_00765 [Kribbella sp. NBC_01484]|uniref:hypothetical protein n=1 Tax=Kribbella sp. NBC_01484 TaxID=2903579 RepID=UPI002E342704|nr:hypothetical protein [Kribbella sp. NBC_01484]
MTDPIAGGNIAYVHHLDPNQGPATAANQVTAGTTSGWGLPLRQYLDVRSQIGWRGWIFDNLWAPVMSDKNWNLISGRYQGAFIREWLAGSPGVSPCSDDLDRGATVVASSTYDASPGAAKAVDGCASAPAAGCRPSATRHRSSR